MIVKQSITIYPLILLVFFFLATAYSSESPRNLMDKSDSEFVATNPEAFMKRIAKQQASMDESRALQSSTQESVNMIIQMTREFVDLYVVYFRRSTCYFLNQCITDTPTLVPSSIPTAVPSVLPTISSSSTPTLVPSVYSSSVPSLIPTVYPSEIPSISLAPSVHIHPSNFPSVEPSAEPTIEPTGIPSSQPSVEPSADPTAMPSTDPTAVPSTDPTAVPSAVPTAVPSSNPTSNPSAGPSSFPSISLMPTTFPGFVSASQSSTFNNAAPASRAIDGNTDQTYGNGSVNHTDNDASGPWWKGVLNRSTTMSLILIYNRQDCCASRIVGFTLSILDDDDNTVWSWTDSSGSAQSIYLIDTSASPAGSQVMVSLNRQDYLHMAEVVVVF